MQDIPESFSSVKSLLYNSCTALSMRLLEVLGHTLKLKVCAKQIQTSLVCERLLWSNDILCCCKIVLITELESLHLFVS